MGSHWYLLVSGILLQTRHALSVSPIPLADRGVAGGRRRGIGGPACYAARTAAGRKEQVSLRMGSYESRRIRRQSVAVGRQSRRS
ncbi:MAG: hypothetical protein MZU97_10595 [Bacillus subtilis]|nr:hypothetical protein [Bacillus subtilis]